MVDTFSVLSWHFRLYQVFGLQIFSFSFSTERFPVRGFQMICFLFGITIFFISCAELLGCRTGFLKHAVSFQHNNNNNKLSDMVTVQNTYE